MFNSLASYFLGGAAAGAEPAPGGINGVGTHNTRLRAVESEEDWVLVDRDSEGNSDTGSLESLDEMAGGDSPLPVRTQLSRTSSSASLPCPSTMEESWFVTPPPCFTSQGPIHMSTSPLENLLIEHPSMSVYQQTRRPGGHSTTPSLLGVSDEDSDDEEIQLQLEEVAVVEGNEPVAIVHMPRLSLLQREHRMCLNNRKAQRARIQLTTANLKKNCLERNNKAREINGRNHRLRRGERSQGATRSYANNNRKC